MTEIHFFVEEAPEGGFVARAMGADIFTEADTLPELHAQVRDAVHCHFEPRRMPSLIHFATTAIMLRRTKATLSPGECPASSTFTLPAKKC